MNFSPATDPDSSVPSAPAKSVLQLPGGAPLEVELTTAQACVFRGSVKAVELKMAEATMEISSPAMIYLNLLHVSELVLHLDTAPLAFELKNAVASFGEGKLGLVAESILPRFVTAEA